MSYFKKYRCAAVSLVVFLAGMFLGHSFNKIEDRTNNLAKFTDAKNDTGSLANRKSVAPVSNDPGAWVNPYTASSPMHKEFDNHRDWVLANKKLISFAGSSDPDRLMEVSNQLAGKGVPALATNLLEQRLSSLTKIFPSLSAHTCSTFLKGGFSSSDFMDQALPTLDSFSGEEAKAWFVFIKTSIDAALSQSPLIVLPTEDATRAVLKITRSLDESRSKAFAAGLMALRTASDEEVCATVRTLYYKGNALSEPYRGYMARMLLTGQRGNEKF
ncbi:hypothetical protein [Paraburkholderia sp. BCC1886]|uniref:hypothetical protein n=1 Tax=Paraburkholderia sp. BCC1886 TaxID=2562670 RepID=UPI0011823FF7|nr:hypothetical protein [Paraburkholderia sp. BCC1886]